MTTTATTVLPVLQPQGADAAATAPLSWVLLLGGLAITAVLCVALVLAVRRSARPVDTRWWVLGGGVVLPGLLLLALHLVNLQHLRRLLMPAPPGTPVIGVTGHDWWWQLRYDGEPGFVTANELVLPAGRPVRLALTSNGVIHSLWVPALAGKLDLVPGRTQHLLLEPLTAGEWRGPCAEFCGSGHARMTLHVRALAPADYAAWHAAQQQPAHSPANIAEQRGRQVFEQQRCAACHTLRGVADGLLADSDSGGPDLTHLASRRHLAAGVLANDAAGLRAWLVDPQRHKPDARMPAYGALDAASLDALVAYLGSLR